MQQATVQRPAAPANTYDVPIESEGSVRLRALSEQQEHSIRKLVELEAQRNGFAHQVTAQTGADKERYVKFLASTEAEIAGLKQTIAEGREQMAQIQAGNPVFAGPPITTVPPDHDEMVFGLTTTEFGMGASLAVTLPLVFALARMMWRRGSITSRKEPAIDDARFTRLEQAVESVAIEVERIGEAQRFASKLLAERQPDEVATRK